MLAGAFQNDEVLTGQLEVSEGIGPLLIRLLIGAVTEYTACFGPFKNP